MTGDHPDAAGGPQAFQARGPPLFWTAPAVSCYDEVTKGGHAVYEAIRRPKKPQRGSTLTVPALICAVLILPVLALSIWAARYQFQYHAFLNDLADSTTLARRSGNYSVRVDGEAAALDESVLSRLFAAISDAGSGRLGDPPDTEPKITVDYGSARLDIWIVPLDNPSNEWTEGPFFRYTDRDGKTYCYDTDQLRPDKFLRLFS